MNEKNRGQISFFATSVNPDTSDLSTFFKIKIRKSKLGDHIKTFCNEIHSASSAFCQ